MYGLLASAFILSGLGAAGCSDEQVAEAPPPASPAPGGKPSVHEDKWLSVTDGVNPDNWLASREAGHDLEQTDPAVADMRRILDVATVRFRDHRRMIANRAVQLEAMLSEKNIDEKAPRLIVTLSQVPGDQRSVESFAALTQQYYNLRVEGLDQSHAIDVLKGRIGRAPLESDHR